MNALSSTQISCERFALYRDFLEERDEIYRHKWLESEKCGYDIGFDKALIEWVLKYRRGWRTNRHYNIRNT